MEPSYTGFTRITKYCSKCHKPFEYLGDIPEPNTVGELPWCTCPKEDISLMQYGWICPRCGRAHSPYIDTCDCLLSN